MQVIIMRGIPGSGKSTWAKDFIAAQQSKDWLVVSADHYHMVGSTYRYDPKNAGAAHAQCLRNFMTAVMERGNYTGSDIDGVIVDNTNTTAWEIAPYYALSLAFQCDVKIVRVHCPLETALPRNVHDVPAARVWQMYQNIMTEKLPPHWVEEIVIGR